MRILVIGAGIGGPAVALALRRAGHDVEVYDRALDFTDVPPAAYLAENGMRAIKHLGLLEDVVREGNHCDRHEIRDFAGNLVAAFPTAGNGADLFTVTIKRTALIRILTNALAKEGVYVHTDKMLVDIEEPPIPGSLGVKAKFKDGTVAYGDILIGADGIHSGVRKSHALHYYTDNANAKSCLLYRTSDRQIKWLVMELKPSEIVSHDSWQPWFDLYQKRALIRGAREIFPTTIYDMELLPQWYRGNCVMFGCAKHVMPPFLGHVSNVVLEDAEVVAALINRMPSDPRKAFRLYQELRHHRVARIAEAVRTHGRRHYSTSKFAAKMGKMMLKIVSAVGGPMSSHEIMSYDGQAAVVEILFRHGYI
ncbi:hypothetical protein DFJ73DRAFT_859691, partial [Zopfochytrium polystomum]